MKFSRLTATAMLAAVLVSACHSTQAQPAETNTIPVPKPAPTLASAIRSATDLGPADTATAVSLSLSLKVRHAQELAALLAAGETISPSAYAARFGPDPGLVQPAIAALRAGGLHSTWLPPSSLIAADGPAPAAALLFQVDIKSYRLPNGSQFYASLDRPRLPPAIAAVATSVSGLDNYRRSHGYAVRPGGLVPTDVLTYYNLKPLRGAGLDGKGQTVLLPEIDDLPNLNDLNKFASQFGLPSFDSVLTVKRNSSWGTPEKPEGETVLDLEIIHAVAPAARLVVYLSAPDFGHSARLGMSHFVATGDTGAFTCGLDQDPAGSFPSTLPTVTAVGGTSVFESQEGVYFKEYAWGSPLDQSGGGGGASQFYAIPDYQKSVGQAAGHGLRQVPDVSADGDPSTGFHILFGGREGQAGGTSASTPLWAATVALINQDLKNKGLHEVGFANPALYWMGENSSKLNPKPFHDVTVGNNLGFDALAGWDFATGWGSMDAAALDAAWIRYIKSGGG